MAQVTNACLTIVKYQDLAGESPALILTVRPPLDTAYTAFCSVESRQTIYDIGQPGRFLE